MILGPVSYLDCLVFCVFLAPQLVLRVGLLETAWTAAAALPFLLLQLPLALVRQRWLTPRARRPPFVRGASAFEDLVVRCVRYAFARVPPRVGRVFMCREVVMPFLRWRMLRHGHLRWPVHWHEHDDANFKGVWIRKDPLREPDIVVYYAHGGGFCMGSIYFYLEFLLAWHALLLEAGYANPAIFGLDYTLVPDAGFPTQLQQVARGYEHVLSVAPDPSAVCVGGDSAGGTLVLGLLLHLAGGPDPAAPTAAGWDGSIPGLARRLAKPGMAVLVSPWPTLVSARFRPTPSDFLDPETLEAYGLEYAGSRARLADPLASPGSCGDAAWWRRAGPTKGGWLITYGAEEMLAPEIHELAGLLGRAGGAPVESREEPGEVHAWPFASLFLCGEPGKRLRGLRGIVNAIGERMR